MNTGEPSSPRARLLHISRNLSRPDLLLCSLSAHRLHFALPHSICTANLPYPSPLPVSTSELQSASYTPSFLGGPCTKPPRTPTNPDEVSPSKLKVPVAVVDNPAVT